MIEARTHILHCEHFWFQMRPYFKILLICLFFWGKDPIIWCLLIWVPKNQTLQKKIVKIIKYIWGKWRNCHFKTKNVHVLVHFDIDFLLALPSFYEFFVWTFCIFCTSSSRQGLLQIFISRIIISKVKFLLGVCSYMVFILAW